MTEQEWRAGTDPTALATHWKPGERKLRLYVCACVRRFRHLLDDERSRRAVEVSEEYADEPRRILDLMEAQEQAREACGDAYRRQDLANLRYEDHLADDP